MATGDSGREAYTAIAWGVGLSHERSDIAGAEGFHSLEGNMCGTAMRGADALPGSKATSRAKGSHRNLGGLGSGRQMLRERDGPHREGEEPKPMMHGHEKSDLVIVAVKPANKARKAPAEASAGAVAAESVERRAGAKGNTHQQSTYWTQNQARVSQALERIRQLVPSHTRGRSRMRESRTYGSGRGACHEMHVPTATAARVHHAARRRGGAWPLAARAQQSGRIVRIGNLSTANPRSAPFYQSFERRLRDLGHIEGQNIVFEYRNAEGEVDRLPDLAAELVRLDASIIVTSTAAATSAVKRATSTIPSLMVAINYDPIALGHVDNLARPGGNVTGLYFQHLELLAKRFGLIKEMLPSISRVAVFFEFFTTDQLEIVQTANLSVGAELQPIHLQNPPYDFENAFRVAARSGAQAIMVLESAPIFRGRHQIVQLAKDRRLPTSFAFREYVQVGGLVLYGVNFSAMYRRAAEYVDKILRGTKPADLPIEQSTKFELVINLKTAKTLGLEMPSTLLALADEVIE